jgi:chaperonin cofactor prefoldin
MPLTGLESKADSALSDLRSSDRVIQQVGIVVKDLATAVEQLSQELDDIKGHVRDLERNANSQLEEELEER